VVVFGSMARHCINGGFTGSIGMMDVHFVHFGHTCASFGWWDGSGRGLEREFGLLKMVYWVDAASHVCTFAYDLDAV
jgi:hypothetical protein